MVGEQGNNETTLIIVDDTGQLCDGHKYIILCPEERLQDLINDNVPL